MFDQILGLPAHPLVTHATVVLTPMLAAVAVAYALVPGLRSRSRWLLAALAVVAPIFAWITEQSGIRFESLVFGPDGAQDEFAAIVRAHQDNGTRAMWAALALGVTGLLLAAAHPGAPAGLRGGSRRRGGAERPGPVPVRDAGAGDPGRGRGFPLRERSPEAHAAVPARPGGPLTAPRTADPAQAWAAPLTGLAVLLVVVALVYTVLLMTGAAGAGHVLLWLALAFAAVAGARHYAQGERLRVSRELTALALVLGLATTWYVVAAGHSGAEAVWKPQAAAELPAGSDGGGCGEPAGGQCRRG